LKGGNILDARNAYEYKHMPNVEVLKLVNSVEIIWNKFLTIIKTDTYQVNLKIIFEIIERVDKKKAHYKIFHNGMNISEYKEASLYGYWISKLKPITYISNKEVNVKDVNEAFAIFFVLVTIRELKGMTDKDFCFNKSFVKSLIYSLKYRNLTEEALITIFDTFYYH